MTGQAMTEPTTNRPFRYDAKLADKIEQHWQSLWDEQGAYRQPNPGETGFDSTKPKFYCLDMFPYPSGAGLHVGHPEGYTATDIICRYKKLKGFNVLHPMGWDAFGLPAEQYAIQTGIHPAQTTRKSIDTFRRQLQRFGFCYDWSREFGTIDEDYYKWTQWIFLQIYNAWFDEEQDKARPIDELIGMLKDGSSGTSALRADSSGGTSALRADLQAKLNAFAADRNMHGNGTTTDVTWSDLSKTDKRAFVGDQRLAYVGEQVVNWCPKLGTALANEEVIDGRSERGGYPVQRTPLKQWMFRITSYAERLLRGLDDVDWPHSTQAMQTAWIGRSEGAEVDFSIESKTSDPPNGFGSLRVYTTRPDTIFGATYMVVSPEHELVEQVFTNPTSETDVDALRTYVDAARNRSDVERQESKEKTGVFTGVYCFNPANNERIQVWVADYVLMGYGTGAIMAVPGQDERDWAFAEAFDLPIVRTVQPPEDFNGKAYVGEGVAINSDFLNGLDIPNAKAKIIDWLEEKEFGERKVNFKLRDWLFSRQRYWGEPFPIVWDEDGNHHAIGEQTLPLTLPPLADYAPEESDTPKPLLAKAHDWVETTAGEAGVTDGPFGLAADAKVTRETNTMPGWAGSCWYFLRYCDNRNGSAFVSQEAEHYWMGDNGVDLYIGGAEHAVLHLLYARFWHKVLFDLGHVGTDEPFKKLFHQGLITSFAYQRADKSLVPIDMVEEVSEDKFVETETGDEVFQVMAKMSKTLKNVVNPDDVIAEYGADTFRLYEMYLGPLEASAPWNPRDIVGLYRFLQRVWRLIVDEDSGELVCIDETNDTVEKQLHRTIAKVGDDIEKISLNTAIAAMIQFVNTASSEGGLTRDQTDRFVRTLSPFAPHIAEEIWSKLGCEGSIAHAEWPTFDDAMLQDDEIEIPVQILGKVRSRIIVPTDADKDTLEKLALADSKIAALIDGKTVRKVIIVPGRMVNIVAN